MCLTCLQCDTRPPDVAQVGPSWPRDCAIGRFPGALGRSLGPPWRWPRSGISHSGSQQPPDAEKTRVFLCFLRRVFRPHRTPRCGPSWPKVAPVPRYWTVSRGSWALSGAALALAALRDQPQRPQGAPGGGKHLFSCVFWRDATPDDSHRTATGPHKFGLPGPPPASKDAI